MHSDAVDTCVFGDIAALREVFAETKQRRRGRHPSYVMIAEDDPLTRRVVTGVLGESHAVIGAENAREAVANYLLYAPDIVFLDIGLPDASGFAVLEQLMAIDPDAFIVMFSSNSSPENMARAEAAGAKGFVPKPFRKEMLRRYIQGSVLYHHKLYA